jgi:hypothetical protein
MNKQTILDLFGVAREYAAGLAPGALGAAVSVMTQKGLTWAQRFIQLAVGIIVSYYAGAVAQEMLGLSEVAKSGVGFTAGIGAYEIVKHLRTSLGKLADQAPADVWAAIKRKLGLGE